MRIIDAFTFFNELDLLEFRLECLYPHVERFVISEANITFSGIPKAFVFEENRDRFSKYLDKIEYLKYTPCVVGLDFKRPERFDGILIRVDFPSPFLPTTPIRSPSAILIVTESKTSRFGKLWEML